MDKLLYPVQIARKYRDYYPALLFLEYFAKRRAHFLFGYRVPCALHIGRIGKKRQNALFAVRAKPRDVEPFAIHGSVVDLEVARMDEDPDRSADGKSHAVGNAVADPDEFEVEWPDLNDLAGDDLDKVRPVEQIVFPEFFPDQGQGEGCAVYRDGQFADEERNGAYVVFMAVCYNKSRPPGPCF